MLELAAKAVGIYLEWDGDPKQWSPMFYGFKTYHAWNPLTDDGDALRLARKLKLEISHSYPDLNNPVVYVRTDDRTLIVELRGDHYVVTRRAIVTMAAEIGRNLK